MNCLLPPFTSSFCHITGIPPLSTSHVGYVMAMDVCGGVRCHATSHKTASVRGSPAYAFNRLASAVLFFARARLTSLLQSTDLAVAREIVMDKTVQTLALLEPRNVLPRRLQPFSFPTRLLFSRDICKIQFETLEKRVSQGINGAL